MSESESDTQASRAPGPRLDVVLSITLHKSVRGDYRKTPESWLTTWPFLRLITTYS